MATVAPAAHRRRPRRLVWKILAAFTVLLLLAFIAVWRLGPRYGLYVLPPSPSGYAQDALKKMDQGYYATGEKWAAARRTAVEQTKEAHSYAQTLPALREALKVAGGKHSRIYNSGQTIGSTDRSRPLPKVTSAGGITTVTVPKEVSGDEEFGQRYADTMNNALSKARPATTCGWIVDARDNHGGAMEPMLAGLSSMIPDGRVAGFRTREGAVSWAEVRGGAVTTGGAEGVSVTALPKTTRPVAVLQSTENGSSGEVVILSLKGLPRVRTFGTQTAGYASGNSVVRLYDGTQMLVTTSVDVDRAGKSTDGAAIAPDQRTTASQAPVVAQAWLRSQCR